MSVRNPNGIKMYAELKQKVCPKCKILKPYSEFHKDRTASNGMCPSCKICKCAMKNGRYRNDHRIRERKDYEHQRGLRRNYGITIERYNEMFTTQEGKCQICKKHQDHCKRKLAVDHDHETKQIRALLCDNCNLGLGNFRHSKELLNKSIRYLEKFQN